MKHPFTPSKADPERCGQCQNFRRHPDHYAGVYDFATTGNGKACQILKDLATEPQIGHSPAVNRALAQPAKKVKP